MPRRTIVVARFASAACALVLGACRSPTEITVVVTTDFGCHDLREVTITTGAPGDAIESLPPSSTSTTCTDGYAGRVVVVPSGSADARVEIKVIGGFAGKNAEDCAPRPGSSPPDYGHGCIVARRALEYVPHTPLTVPIVLRASCDGIPCGATDTCVSGACVPSAITDPGACAGGGCDECKLAGTCASDAGVDASVTAAPECGDMRGLQPGAPWPMHGYCAALINRSPHPGPATKPTKRWSFSTGGSGNNAGFPPAVGADGVLYLAAGALFAVDASGVQKWRYTAPGETLGGVPALGADGKVYVTSGAGTLHAVDMATGAGAALYAATAGSACSPPALGPDGTIYFSSPADHAVLAVDRSGAKRWSFDAGASVGTTPAIGPDGTLYVGSAADALFAVDTKTGAQLWTRTATGSLDNSPLVAAGRVFTMIVNPSFAATTMLAFDAKTGAPSWQQPNIVPNTDRNVMAVGADGNLYVQPNAVQSLDPSTGAIRWTAAGTGAANWCTVGGTNRVYAADGSSIYAVDSSGAEVWRYAFPDQPSTAVVGADDTLYAIVAGDLWALHD